MSHPTKFTQQPCPRCGRPESIVNPQWLRAVRIAAGLTLREVARRLKFSVVYLSNIERGKRAALPPFVKFYESLEKLGGDPPVGSPR